MKTLLLLLSIVVSGANAQTMMTPYTQCGNERNQLMRFQAQASGDCMQAIQSAKKCCANGEGSCLVPAIPVAASTGMKKGSAAYQAGEVALQTGLTKNREKCYEARERMVDTYCAAPQDEQVKKDYHKADGAVVDCLDSEFMASKKRMGAEVATENSVPARVVSSEEIVKALTPKGK